MATTKTDLEKIVQGMNIICLDVTCDIVVGGFVKSVSLPRGDWLSFGTGNAVNTYVFPRDHDKCRIEYYLTTPD